MEICIDIVGCVSKNEVRWIKGWGLTFFVVRYWKRFEHFIRVSFQYEFGNAFNKEVNPVVFEMKNDSFLLIWVSLFLI